jgi:hypothetical protein
MKNIACLLFCLCLQQVYAQNTVNLTPEELKSFEGVFQNARNKDLNVQFTADSNALQAKLLWNGGRLKVYPSAPLEFYSKEGETVNIKFVKGPDGKINQLSLGNGDTWNRVYNYHPLVRTEAAHTPEQLKVYEGLFQLGDDRFIQFTEKSNQLILKQHWDGQELPFVPDSAWDFFNKTNLTFNLHFIKGTDGSVEKVLAFKRDLWTKVHPVDYSPAQLVAFEGKYQLKDDKDDIIQIRASGKNLVIKQLWDGKETVLVPQADLYFYCASESYPAKFTKDASGNIVGATMLSGDEFEKIKN